MKTHTWQQKAITVSAVLSAFGLTATITLGCSHYVEDYFDPLTLIKGIDGGGGGDGDGGPPPGCIPSENPMVAVAPTCGIFVSPAGSDASLGTQEDPVLTLGHALSIAKGKPVYACAGGTPFKEALTVPAGSVLYGGLNCSNWTYVGAATKTKLTADAGLVPLTLAMGTGTEIHDLHVLAAEAVDQGGSSIAVIADHTDALLDGCVIEASNGRDGSAGTMFSEAATSGANGLNGNDACTGSSVSPGLSVNSICGIVDSISGAGGLGQLFNGGDGSDGLPMAATNRGVGEAMAMCTTGIKGDDGEPGMPGLGAMGLGMLGPSGFTGLIGGDGTPGVVAQGGGGGGGAKGGIGANKCSTVGMEGGAAGGSGGSGGCGGLGGKGGNPGGSSIAILSLDSTFTFINATIRAGNGGKGGDGGLGQQGGGPGMPGKGGKVPGSSLNPGCDGGFGGFGGDGGKGGGGLGGHAIAIAYMGKSPSTTGVMITKGTAGAGGLGDNTNDNMGDGASGVSMDLQAFP